MRSLFKFRPSYVQNYISSGGFINTIIQEYTHNKPCFWLLVLLHHPETTNMWQIYCEGTILYVLYTIYGLSYSLWSYAYSWKLRFSLYSGTVITEGRCSSIHCLLQFLFWPCPMPYACIVASCSVGYLLSDCSLDLAFPSSLIVLCSLDWLVDWLLDWFNALKPVHFPYI